MSYKNFIILKNIKYFEQYLIHQKINIKKLYHYEYFQIFNKFNIIF